MPLSGAVFNKELPTVQGGRFELGFISAFTSSLALSYTTGKSNDPLAIMGIGAAIGGTAEALGGGKFANGAVTGAFVGLFNHGMHEDKTQDEVKLVDISQTVGQFDWNDLSPNDRAQYIIEYYRVWDYEKYGEPTVYKMFKNVPKVLPRFSAFIIVNGERMRVWMHISTQEIIEGYDVKNKSGLHGLQGFDFMQIQFNDAMWIDVLYENGDIFEEYLRNTTNHKDCIICPK